LSDLSAGKASPNDTGVIVIIVVIIGEEVKDAVHGDDIIAQEFEMEKTDSVMVFSRSKNEPRRARRTRRKNKNLSERLPFVL
jgi:hypothetical protein